MILINKLKNKDSFSESEQVIVDYILSNPKDIPNMHIEQLSALTYVSNSTIVRFAQKLGFKGFSDFKIKLASEINSFLIENERIEVDMPILADDTNETINKNFLNLHYHALTDAFHSIDLDELRQCAKLINESSLITLWGRGPSELIALDFHYKLRRLGYLTMCDPLIGFDLLPKKRRTDKHIGLIVSNYGNSNVVRQWISELQSQNVPIILVCGNRNSPFIRFAKHAIIVESDEKRVSKMGHFASRTAMSYAMDILYAMIFSFNYNENVKILYEEGLTTNEQGDYLKNLKID